MPRRNGFKTPDDVKRKISRTLLKRGTWHKGKKTGIIPKTAFKKGRVPWNKSKKTGKPSSTSFKKGIIPWNKGLKGIGKGIKRSSETRKKMSGRNCHLWKGGITPENKKIRSSIDMRIWRIAVFERDGYTCQVCKKVGVILNSHHIKSFAHYPELRFDIDNGVTLCEDCHKLTDNFANSKKL